MKCETQSLHRALPTRAELYRYGLIDNELNVCLLSVKKSETLEHLFWDRHVQELHYTRKVKDIKY